MTGSGQISGRLLGVQATSAAVGFPSSSSGSIWGNPVAPVYSTFTWVDQGTATGADSTIAPNGVIMQIPQGGHSDTRRKLCQTLHAPPFTVEFGVITEKYPNTFQDLGLTLRDSGTGKEELFNMASTASYWTVSQCPSNLGALCNNLASGFGWIPTGMWIYGRVVDDGAIRGYDVSLDGVNWWRSTSRFGSDDPGPVYGFATYNQACMHIWLNTNSGPWHSRFFHWRIT